MKATFAPKRGRKGSQTHLLVVNLAWSFRGDIRQTRRER